jgi:hypothetical protein
MPLLAFEKTRIAWNQRVRGVLDLWNTVPAVGEILKRHFEHWNFLFSLFTSFMREYVPPQEHFLLWCMSKR